MSIVFCFSGQGSHYYQMGKTFYDENQVFRNWMERLDEEAHKLCGQSIIREIYNQHQGKSGDFKRTLLTHPAIFMVEYATAMLLESLGIYPEYVLGASLGEFTAASVAGALTPEATLRYVVAQARVLEEQCESGGMLAVLESPALYEREAVLNENSTMAGINYEKHFVLSCASGSMDRICLWLKKKGITFFVLPVSLPFHSSLIDRGEERYKQELLALSHSPLSIPLASCCYKKVIHELPRGYLWEIVRRPISFAQTVPLLEERGPLHYIDAGPSGTLATFLKYLLPPSSSSKLYTTLNQFRQDKRNLEELQAAGLRRETPEWVKKNIKGIEETSKQVKEQKMIVYVFPGQGAQKKGMGENLFKRFADLTARADAVLGYSIRRLCLEDPDGVLGQTQYTQPALYTVSALGYLAEVEDSRVRPDYVAGHSLGEYAALFAAGVYDFETGLKIVQERGRLMAQASGGGMAAVIGLEDEEVRRILADNKLDGIDVANFNSPGQVVISGLKDDILNAREFFDAGGAKMYVPLQVSGAFHSRYMKQAAEDFAAFINQFQWEEPRVPVISNVTARPYGRGELPENLIKQMTHSVKWTESVRYLMGKGDFEFKELGYGNVLTKLITKIKKTATPLVVNEETGKVDTGESGLSGITVDTLGSTEFKRDYGLKYAYVTGAMYKGIASPELVIRMGKAGLMGFLGTGGMRPDWIEESIRRIQQELKQGEAYGMNLLCDLNNPQLEEDTVDLYLKYGVTRLEAAAYMQVTPALVKYRARGLQETKGGGVNCVNKVMAKISRPEVAAAFLTPAPERVVNKLLEAGKISSREAELLGRVPMADDICVEADSGGHTDMGVAYTLMPALLKLRDEMMEKYGYTRRVRVGAAGGIGSPEAAAAAFILGADFILTGSINQCTVEGGTSDVVKDMLQQMNVQDTEYAPAGDMFELGAKVQVLRKGVFFPARANKLYALYVQYNSLEEIDEVTRRQLEEKYFKRSFGEIWEDCRSFFGKNDPAQLARAEKSPKYKMALVFRWYFGLSTRMALQGDVARKVDFQIQCGPALGAFNQWVKGTELEDWRRRHVDEIGTRLMQATAELLNNRFDFLSRI